MVGSLMRGLNYMRALTKGSEIAAQPTQQRPGMGCRHRSCSFRYLLRPCQLRATASSNRPFLVSGQPSLSQEAHHTLHLLWTNTGNQTVRNPIATLLTLSDDLQNKLNLGTQPLRIKYQGSTPENAAEVRFPVDMQQFLGRFLVCVTYFGEESKSYSQAFLYEPPEGGQEPSQYMEMQPPSDGLCPGKT